MSDNKNLAAGDDVQLREVINMCKGDSGYIRTIELNYSAIKNVASSNSYINR